METRHKEFFEKLRALLNDYDAVLEISGNYDGDDWIEISMNGQNIGSAPILNKHLNPNFCLNSYLRTKE